MYKKSNDLKINVHRKNSFKSTFCVRNVYTYRHPIGMLIADRFVLILYSVSFFCCFLHRAAAIVPKMCVYWKSKWKCKKLLSEMVLIEAETSKIPNVYLRVSEKALSRYRRMFQLRNFQRTQYAHYLTVFEMGAYSFITILFFLMARSAFINITSI